MRYRFGPEFGRALQVRGLHAAMVATMAKVSPGTVASALRGQAVNMTTATRIAKAVAICPVIPELEEWGAAEAHAATIHTVEVL